MCGRKGEEGVILALQAADGVHLGVDNLDVVRHVGRVLDGNFVSCPNELVKDGDLILLIGRMLEMRGRDTVRTETQERSARSPMDSLRVRKKGQRVSVESPVGAPENRGAGNVLAEKRGEVWAIVSEFGLKPGLRAVRPSLLAGAAQAQANRINTLFRLQHTPATSSVVDSALPSSRSHAWAPQEPSFSCIWRSS